MVSSLSVAIGTYIEASLVGILPSSTRACKPKRRTESPSRCSGVTRFLIVVLHEQAWD